MQPLCQLCSRIFKNPVECNLCRTNICEEHIKDLKKCPICRKYPFKPIKNEGLIKILNELENERINKMIKMDDNIYQCKLCSFEGPPVNLIYHLAEEHRKALIENFGRKKEIKNEKIKNIIKPINVKLPSFSSLIEEDNQNINNFKLRHKSEEIKFGNFLSQRNYKNNESKNKNFISQSLNNNLYYCGKKNGDINCDCCSPENKCIKGNCLCIKCMEYNIKKLNLKNGGLINKAGRPAYPENGDYHCVEKCSTYIINDVGLRIPVNKICSYNKYICEECKILNKYKDIYIDYIYRK